MTTALVYHPPTRTIKLAQTSCPECQVNFWWHPCHSCSHHKKAEAWTLMMQS